MEEEDFEGYEADVSLAKEGAQERDRPASAGVGVSLRAPSHTRGKGRAQPSWGGRGTERQQDPEGSGWWGRPCSLPLGGPRREASSRWHTPDNFGRSEHQHIRSMGRGRIPGQRGVYQQQLPPRLLQHSSHFTGEELARRPFQDIQAPQVVIFTVQTFKSRKNRVKSCKNRVNRVKVPGIQDPAFPHIMQACK